MNKVQSVATNVLFQLVQIKRKLQLVWKEHIELEGKPKCRFKRKVPRERSSDRAKSQEQDLEYQKDLVLMDRES